MATVLLTGASGFLGIHTTRALLDAGHHVRAYVRSPARLTESLRLVGLDGDPRVEAAQGDMTDAAAVSVAASGCDAAIHAAATFSFKRRDRDAMVHENAAGTRAVLESAVAAGCSPVVHVSSTVALNRRGGSVLDGHSPLGDGPGPYSTSKVASEGIARALQEQGAPVTIVNPGSVLGPDDPYLGESNEITRDILAGRMPVWPQGLLHYVDVREVATTLVAALSAPPGGRYLVPGHARPTLHEPLREVTGRRLPVLVLPAALAAQGAMPGYLTGWSMLPSTVEGARLLGCANPVDATVTTKELGVEARPLQETLRDTVRWLVDAGHLPRKAAGRALGG